jgi:putative oxidoreductase
MIKKLLSTTSYTTGFDLSLFLLRITFGGFMLINHGIGKMNKLFAGGEISFPDPFGIGSEASLGLAVFSEVVCAALLVLGLFTRLALIPLLITMLVAVFVIHIGDGLKDMEAAILYLIAYSIIFINGAGKYSIDNSIFNK